MRVLDPGHCYAVEIYDRQDPTVEEFIWFMKRLGEKYPGNTGYEHEGTNIQELLRVIIDRLKYLNNQIPCEETRKCIRLGREMVFELEMRAKRVKGKVLTENKSGLLIEEIPACKTCGHIFCEEDHS